MSDDVKAQRKPVDWEAMEPEWRIGIKSVLQLSKEYGVSRPAIDKHWAKEGIERDLSARIKAKADALVAQATVAPEVAQSRRETERSIVDASATMIADKVINQRTDILRARSIVQKLWALVDAELDQPAEFAQLGEILRSEDEFGNDKLNDMYRAAIGLPQQVKNVKLLADALKVLIELERKVLKIDSMPDPDDSAKKTGEEMGRAVADGVNSAMAALAEKVAEAAAK